MLSSLGPCRGGVELTVLACACDGAPLMYAINDPHAAAPLTPVCLARAVQVEGSEVVWQPLHS